MAALISQHNIVVDPLSSAIGKVIRQRRNRGQRRGNRGRRRGLRGFDPEQQTRQTPRQHHGRSKSQHQGGCASFRRCRTTLRRISCRAAPRAMRIPNSLVRRLTAHEITPWIPTAAGTSASPPDKPRSMRVKWRAPSDLAIQLSSDPIGKTGCVLSTLRNTGRTAFLGRRGSLLLRAARLKPHDMF